MTRFQLKIDLAGFEDKIYRALEKKLKPVLLRVANTSSVRIQKRFRTLIENSRTIQSLQGGTLKGEFGIKDILSRIDKILDNWTRNLIVKHKKISITQKGLTGGFRLQMVRSDWSEVLKDDDNADLFITPENKFHLQWLKWLLTEGSTRVVVDYDFSRRSAGRTGEGIMIKGFERKFWNVPADFRGTTDNNFVVDVVELLRKDLRKILIDEFKRAI